MKYVIKWETELGTTHYLESIPGARRQLGQREWYKHAITHTQTLTKAMLYDSWDAASGIILFVHKAGHFGRIYGVDDRELFKARLYGK